ncbi:hypothetical protein ACOSQ3_004414 [Xanthoceras sorbifolium]
MTLIIRCVQIASNPIEIDEYFLEFLNVDDTTGLGLSKALVDVINSLGLDIDNVRGQRYDNGSNMKGKHQVDIALSQLRIRFEKLQFIESTFGFLFNAAKLICDIDAYCLCSELQVLQVMLPSESYQVDTLWTAIKILEFVKSIDMFPNAMIAYRILLTIPVTVASAERSFSKLKLDYVVGKIQYVGIHMS